MEKKHIVYVIYGKDVEALDAVIDRLIEKGITFSFSGEYIYGGSPWNNFISECCSDLADRLFLSTEYWANYPGYETIAKTSEIDFYVEGIPCGRVKVEDNFVMPVKFILSKLCSLAASTVDIKYNIKPINP